MVDKISCPHCNNLNDVHKFCIYCGEKLLDDDQFKLITEDTDPTCLNCGRPVKKIKRNANVDMNFVLWTVQNAMQKIHIQTDSARNVGKNFGYLMYVK